MRKINSVKYPEGIERERERETDRQRERSLPR